MSRRNRELERLVALERAHFRTVADEAELAKLRRVVGLRLRRASHRVDKAVSQRALAVRGVGSMPRAPEMRRALRAAKFIDRVREMLTDRSYADSGRIRVLRLIREVA